MSNFTIIFCAFVSWIQSNCNYGITNIVSN
uniref:Uncharacterized protein n=1 Tax=Arundo donax TaxID=35708 RepID=A0A0A8Y792_ARUDO